MICYVFKRRRRIDGQIHESREWFGALRMEWEHGAPRKWCLVTADKREAERLLHEARTLAEKRHYGLAPSAEATKAGEQPLNELLATFLEHLRVIGRTDGTVDKYANMKVLFHRCGWNLTRDVTARTFCDWRARSKLSGKTLNDLLKNTCNFFEWLRRERFVTENPLEFVEVVKLTPKSFRRALTPEQAQRLLAVAPHERAVIYLVAMQHGLRRKELQGLTVADFVFDTPAPFLRVAASLSKNRTGATLFLRPEVTEAIRSVLPKNAEPTAKIFPAVARISTLRRDLAKADIPFEDAQGRRVDLHSLRVTLGSNLFASGASLVVVKELMRHSDIKTTLRHYSDVSQLPLAQAVANLPAFNVPKLGTLLGTQTGTQTGVAGCHDRSHSVARIAY